MQKSIRKQNDFLVNLLHYVKEFKIVSLKSKYLDITYDFYNDIGKNKNGL